MNGRLISQFVSLIEVKKVTILLKELEITIGAEGSLVELFVQEILESVVNKRMLKFFHSWQLYLYGVDNRNYEFIGINNKGEFIN